MTQWSIYAVYMGIYYLVVCVLSESDFVWLNCFKAEDEVRDAVLVTDGDSEIGQVCLPFIISLTRITCLVVVEVLIAVASWSFIFFCIESLSNAIDAVLSYSPLHCSHSKKKPLYHGLDLSRKPFLKLKLLLDKTMHPNIEILIYILVLNV